MITLTRTDSANLDFIALVKLLDAYLAVQDGDEHAFYDQYNKTAFLTQVVVVYEDGKAIGCGALKQLTLEAMEVKRMYTLPESRGKKIATQILDELERWAKEFGYQKCMLETGIRQPEAIALYKKCGYQIIPNYGQYLGVANSVCFEKTLQ